MRNLMLVLSSAALAVLVSNSSSARADDPAISELKTLVAGVEAAQHSAEASARLPPFYKCPRLGIKVREWPVVQAPGARVVDVTAGGPSDGVLNVGDYVLLADYKVSGTYVLKPVGYGEDMIPLEDVDSGADANSGIVLLFSRAGTLLAKTVKIK